MTQRWLTTAAAVGLILGGAACGGGDDDDDGGAASSAPSDADLIVTAVPTIRWDASEYTAPAGSDVIELRQDDPSSKHTLAIIDDAGTQVGPVLEVTGTGDVASDTYQLEAGSYTIQCTVPGHDQMKATLAVT